MKVTLTLTKKGETLCREVREVKRGASRPPRHTPPRKLGGFVSDTGLLIRIHG